VQLRVRCARADLLTAELIGLGASVRTDRDGSLLVTGGQPETVGDVACSARVPLYELGAESASLVRTSSCSSPGSVHDRGGAAG
jgi:hypothetical protein